VTTAAYAAIVPAAVAAALVALAQAVRGAGLA